MGSSRFHLNMVQIFVKHNHLDLFYDFLFENMLMWNQLPNRQVLYRISSSNSIGVAIRELEMMMFLFPPNDLEVRDSPAVSGCCRCNLSQQLQTPKQCFVFLGVVWGCSADSAVSVQKKKVVIECVYIMPMNVVNSL